MLTSVDDIVEALGGTGKVARATGVVPSAVSNWRAAKKIPSDQYLNISTMLKEIDQTAAPGVFGFAPPAPAPTEGAAA